jgi:hypothetical protein
VRSARNDAAVLAIGIVLTVGLAGCGGAAHSDEARLAESLQELASQWLAEGDLSGWDRAVVERAAQTGRISQADYEEGAQLFESCLRDAGQHFARTTHLNGVIEFQPPQVATSEAEGHQQGRIQEACYQATYGATQELFRLQQANPQLLSDFSLAAVTCLQEAGLVADDFTKGDLDTALAPRDSALADSPFDVMDPRAQTCLYSLGWAVVVDAG